MAEEVMKEKEFPCPCGKGILRVEVVEHDVWASGRHERWQLRCDDCRENYRELFLVGGLVKREDNDEAERRRHAIYERRLAIGALAVARYLSRFSEYVKSLRFKTAMRDAIGGSVSIGTFREKTRSEDGLNRAIETGLRTRPADALRHIGVDDPDIFAELRAIAEDEETTGKFIEGIPKFPIPRIDTRVDC